MNIKIAGVIMNLFNVGFTVLFKKFVQCKGVCMYNVKQFIFSFMKSFGIINFSGLLP